MYINLGDELGDPSRNHLEGLGFEIWLLIVWWNSNLGSRMGELCCLIYSFLSSVGFSWGICSYMFGNSSGKKTMKWVTLLKDFKEKVGLSQPPASAPSTPSPPPQRDRISSSSSINANDLSPTSPDYWSLPSRLDFYSTEELWPSSYFLFFFFFFVCWQFLCFTQSFSFGKLGPNFTIQLLQRLDFMKYFELSLHWDSGWLDKNKR